MFSACMRSLKRNLPVVCFVGALTHNFVKCLVQFHQDCHGYLALVHFLACASWRLCMLSLRRDASSVVSYAYQENLYRLSLVTGA